MDGEKWCERSDGCCYEGLIAIDRDIIGRSLLTVGQYTSGYLAWTHPNIIHSNFGGNHTKSMKVSLESSLKRLKTSYVDIVRSTNDIC